MEQRVEQALGNAPSVPFDGETWGRMVDLVNFLRMHEMTPDAEDRLGQVIVRLRFQQLREGRSDRATAGPTRRRTWSWGQGNGP